MTAMPCDKEVASPGVADRAENSNVSLPRQEMKENQRAVAEEKLPFSLAWLGW